MPWLAVLVLRTALGREHFLRAAPGSLETSAHKSVSAADKIGPQAPHCLRTHDQKRTQTPASKSAWIVLVRTILFAGSSLSSAPGSPLPCWW